MPEITFCGEQFEVPTEIAVMPLMEFAALARAGLDTDDLEGLAAMRDLIKSCITDEDWDRFRQVATEHKADGTAIWATVQDVFRVHAERPTSLHSDSSDGQDGTFPASEGDSFSRVISRLEAQGRPELALVAKQTQEFLAG